MADDQSSCYNSVAFLLSPQLWRRVELNSAQGGGWWEAGAAQRDTLNPATRRDAKCWALPLQLCPRPSPGPSICFQSYSRLKEGTLEMVPPHFTEERAEAQREVCAGGQQNWWPICITSASPKRHLQTVSYLHLPA